MRCATLSPFKLDYDSQFTNYDKTMTIDKQLAYLRKGTTEIIREQANSIRDARR